MSNARQTNAAPRQTRDANREAHNTRRALVFAASPPGESLPARLADAGYDARAVRRENASRSVSEFAPHVALIEVAAGERGEAQLALARRLRTERATAALPLVLLFERDDASLRASALEIGADDYFALSTPPAEIAARLDALFWRAEAGRRAATLNALEQRAEIDDFLQLLDAVRADVESGTDGALALVAAAAREETPVSPSQENRTLAGAYAFFKLNLRRADSVAFYGPTLLLVYLPGKTENAAQASLARLSQEFMEAQPGGVLSVGLASFPADGTEIESLIERAEGMLEATQPQEDAEESAPDNADAGATPVDSSTTQTSPPSQTSPSSVSPEQSQPPTSERHRALSDRSPSRAVRESKQADSSVTSMPGDAGAAHSRGTLAQADADAAARERERRTRGAIMPRRLLLTISDPARMAQINLLLRSAGYEVRAAFDGLQAINLLRIERPDLLVIDETLYGIDGLEALRRLYKQHHDRLPLPVVVLLSNSAERDRVRAEARALGAQGFVQMPYDPEELLTSVRTVGSTD